MSDSEYSKSNIEICKLERCLQLVGNRQKGESQTGVSRKQGTPNFPKNEHFLPADTCTRTFAYQALRNVRFSENLACFVFLKHLF